MPLLFSVGSIGGSEFLENAPPLLTLTLKNCFHLVSLGELFLDLSMGLELRASDGVLLFLEIDFRVADRWWLVAGLRRVGTFDVSPASRCDDWRLTSLFGGKGVAACVEPTIGTVEPVLEKAAEAFEGERTGDSGRGLEGELEVFDMAERRFIQEGRVRRLNRGTKASL